MLLYLANRVSVYGEKTSSFSRDSLALTFQFFTDSGGRVFLYDRKRLQLWHSFKTHLLKA